jgi:DNA (cytosine-5)-methyltransferase 1
MSLNAIDLFSGAGGLHIGFEQAGYNIKLCIDNNDLVEKTHKRNFFTKFRTMVNIKDENALTQREIGILNLLDAISL